MTNDPQSLGPDRGDSSGSEGPHLLSVQGSWWVRRGCLAVARGGFRHERDPEGGPWTRWARGYSLRHRTFARRDGEGVLAGGGLRLVSVAVTPDAPLTVRLHRLIAFEDGLEFKAHFVRRIPLSTMGGWPAVALRGAGTAVAALRGASMVVELGDDPGDIDFDPESVVAWSGHLTYRIALHRLTWRHVLSPTGYRETRMVFDGAGTVWVDAGTGPAVPGPRPSESGGRRGRTGMPSYDGPRS